MEEVFSTWAAVKRLLVRTCDAVVSSPAWRVVEGIGCVGGVVEIIPNRINRVRGPDLKHCFPRLLSGRFEASRAN